MLTRLHQIVTARVDGRAFTVLRTAIGAVALIKGVHLVFRFVAQADFPHRTWLSWSPDLLVPVTGAVVLLAWLGSALALAVGVRPRLAAAMLAVLTGLFVLDSRLYNQHLYLLGLVCLLIAVADLSADDWRPSSVRHTATVSEWPLFLLKLQASAVYGFGAIAKLSADFVTGRVLYTVLVGQPVAGLLGSLTTDPRFLVTLSLAVIAIELFLAISPWFPGARGAMLAVAGPFHLGMVVFLPPDVVGFVALFVFGCIQLSILLFLFAPSERLLVVWDDQCSFCSRWVAAFQRLDWLGHLDFLPLSRPDAYAAYGITQDAALEALQLRSADGSIHAGFEAVRRVAYALPLSMLLAPWLSLPPVRWVGARTYRRTARRRHCRLGDPAELTHDALPGAGG